MQILMTMTVGEFVVGLGTILLALFAGWTIVADWLRKKKTSRINKLDGVEDWVKQVQGATDEELHDPICWESYEGACRKKKVLLSRLLALDSVGLYIKIPAERLFKKYKFEKRYDQYMDSYHKYTDKLHDLLDGKEEYEDEEEEVEFMNATNDFHKYLVEIRMKEKE